MLRLTDLQIDALKEIANIGAGHAATALSQLLDHAIKLEPPKAELLQFGSLSKRIGDSKDVATLHFYVRGEIPGLLVVLFDHRDALIFIGETKLREAAEIVASSYLGALVQLTGINMISSPPLYAYGSMSQALGKLVRVDPRADVLFVESTFIDRGAKVYGHIVFVPDAGSIEPLLAAFGV